MSGEQKKIAKPTPPRLCKERLYEWRAADIDERIGRRLRSRPIETTEIAEQDDALIGQAFAPRSGSRPKTFAAGAIILAALACPPAGAPISR
jgi:hypothetical protein